MILNVYKPQGLTPLQTIHLLREKFPEYKNKKIGFAGRLDPLAHGVLLLMIDEETTKEKDTFLNLPKEYEFEAVFGVTTDTYDALGIVSPKVKSHKTTKDRLEDFRRDDLMTFINSKLGKQTQSYPPYSSKTVHGKPLYQWAREDKINEIIIPTREIEMYDFQLLKTNTISAKKLKEKIMKQIDSVTGDFRQEEIKKSWEKFFETFSNRHPGVAASHDRISFTKDSIASPDNNRVSLQNDIMNAFQTAKFRVSCSSGTYVRSLVHELGKQLNTGAITLEILRTKVGEYSLSDAKNVT